MFTGLVKQKKLFLAGDAANGRFRQAAIAAADGLRAAMEIQAGGSAMQVVAAAGRDDLARVYIARNAAGHHVEFVESLQPPWPREKKWVLIVSCLYGCPFACRICDAGGDYRGRLSREEIEFQIDYLVDRRFPDRDVPCEKFKIQFARMGEPALNPAVLDAIAALPERLEAPGLIVSLSTIAPAGCEDSLPACWR